MILWWKLWKKYCDENVWWCRLKMKIYIFSNIQCTNCLNCTNIFSNQTVKLLKIKYFSFWKIPSWFKIRNFVSLCVVNKGSSFLVTCDTLIGIFGNSIDILTTFLHLFYHTGSFSIFWDICHCFFVILDLVFLFLFFLLIF